ncbi:MAG: hypothetical protein ACRDH2_03090, partial [Anaerolineales bacterium]
MKRLFSGLFCLLLLAAPVAPARAQAGDGGVTVTAVDTSGFPEIRVYLSVNNVEGERLPGLSAGPFELSEDGSPVSELTVIEQEVGVQAVFVLDTSAAFKVRDANGVNRLDHIRQALADFAQAQMQDELDDVTVLSPEGMLIGHSTRGGEVAAALEAYTTTFAGAADAFPLLNAALDAASDATPRPGMRRYVVFISNGLPPASANGPLTDLAARATTAHIPIYAVYVGPAGSENTSGAQSLNRLAELTGGEHSAFSNNVESFTPLFQHLAGQRTQYRLNYRSAINATGQHTLAARVRLDDGAELVSGESTFPLRVEPPAVSLRDMPVALEHTESEATDYAVPIKVDFLDGHARALTEAELIVDGQSVSIQSGPGETLAWPLAGYTESGMHTLQVRVTDELGLSAESEPLEVTLTIRPAVPTSQPAALPQTLPIRSNLPLNVVLALSALVLVGGVAAGWLWWSQTMRRRARVAAPAHTVFGATAPTAPVLTSQAPTDPLLKPPAPDPEKIRPARRIWPAPGHAVGAAYFEVLEPGGGGALRDDIPLYERTLRLGRDAA